MEYNRLPRTVNEQTGERVVQPKKRFGLSAERVQKLESTGFVWSAKYDGRKYDGRRNNEQWEAMFARLNQYKGIHGDCLVPKRYANDPKLGTWVETQVSMP